MKKALLIIILLIIFIGLLCYGIFDKPANKISDKVKDELNNDINIEVTTNIDDSNHEPVATFDDKGNGYLDGVMFEIGLLIDDENHDEILKSQYRLPTGEPYLMDRFKKGHKVIIYTESKEAAENVKFNLNLIEYENYDLNSVEIKGFNVHYNLK